MKARGKLLWKMPEEDTKEYPPMSCKQGLLLKRSAWTLH